MLVAVVSVKGSPGSTTFSVALAAHWPQTVRTLLVEADPSGGDIATRFSLTSTPGLLSLAAAARRTGDPAVVWQHTHTLAGGRLPVVLAPADADRARAALTALPADPVTGTGILWAVANSPGTVVIADCGRVDPGSAAMPIVRSADAMILLTRAHADDLAHLAYRLPVIGRWNTHPLLVLVGDGYSPTEVARELGIRPAGHVPHDPRGAAVLRGNPSLGRRGRNGPARSALGHAAHAIATTLVPPQPLHPQIPHQAPATSRVVPLVRPVPGAHPTTGPVNGHPRTPSTQLSRYGATTLGGGQA